MWPKWPIGPKLYIWYIIFSQSLGELEINT